MKRSSTWRPYLISFLLLVSGCEGYRQAVGTVVDYETYKPLDSVYCNVLTGGTPMYTDTTGKFNVQNPFGSCMPCKDITVEFSKPGYRNYMVTNPKSEITVPLERQ